MAAFAAGFLGAGPGLALISGIVGIVIRWPEIRAYRANWPRGEAEDRTTRTIADFCETLTTGAGAGHVA